MAMKHEHSVDVIEIEAVEGRLEFGFFGWLDRLGHELWHWFTGGTVSGGSCAQGQASCVYYTHPIT